MLLNSSGANYSQYDALVALKEMLQLAQVFAEAVQSLNDTGSGGAELVLSSLETCQDREGAVGE